MGYRPRTDLRYLDGAAPWLLGCRRCHASMEVWPIDDLAWYYCLRCHWKTRLHATTEGHGPATWTLDDGTVVKNVMRAGQPPAYSSAVARPTPWGATKVGGEAPISLVRTESMRGVTVKGGSGGHGFVEVGLYRDSSQVAKVANDGKGNLYVEATGVLGPEQVLELTRIMVKAGLTADEALRALAVLRKPPPRRGVPDDALDSFRM